MDAEEARRPAWKRKAAGIVLAMFVLLLLGLWTQRKPIARDIVDRTLRARGVPGRYTIAALGPGTQRLTNVSIGDPAAPDLTAAEVELHLGYGFGLPSVRSVTARGVRLRGRLVDGAVSFGAVDRLLPPPSSAPFTLPDLKVDLADAVLLLATPAGGVTARVSGRGNLADGFVGRIAANAPRLASGGCVSTDAVTNLAVRIADRSPAVSGPVAAARVQCAGVMVELPRLGVAAKLAESLAPQTLAMTVATGPARRGDLAVGAIRGRIDYDAREAQNRHGAVSLTGETVRAPQGSARQASLEAGYRIGGAVALREGSARPLRVEGSVDLAGASLPAGQLARASTYGASFGSTPLAPLAEALGRSIARAGLDVSGRAAIAFDGDIIQRSRATRLAGEARLTGLTLASRSGARLRFGGGDGARLRIEDGATHLDGVAELAGGGLPSARLQLRQGDAGLYGEAVIAPYAAGGARLALSPVRVTREAGGAVRFVTQVTLDGPLGDGRVTGLALPINGRVDRAITVNGACVPLRFATLSIAGVNLGTTQLPLCPIGGAMLRIANGRSSGGMAVPAPRLSGRVGTQPLTIASRDLRVDIGTPGFVADALAMRLGEATRLDVARLAGRIDGGGVGGAFTDAGGRIANVPLLLSGGEGRWRLASGRLNLDGRLVVADEASPPRFNPLVSQDVALDLTGGVIRAHGTLREPNSGLAVTNVALVHDLSAGTGNATLDVPGITFGPAFQPEALTRLTLGVVANVAGTVAGQGRIAWGQGGVTSTGDFATEKMDLAAVFGPVTGITTKIHFSDLLGLVTPPGQIVTVAGFNPGIAVEGGVIGYQLLPGQKVAVGGGKWPFAGGALILEPTVLDFGQPVERRMTFRVEGLQAGTFLEQFDFKNIAVTGTFDGELPMIFDEKGGRISGGRLVVRKAGGTLAYVGELTNADLGMFGKMAFDALKSIRYQNLAIELDGALDSEIVSRIVFTGTNESPVADKRPRGLLRNLTGLPFKFNIVIRAPFRGLTNSASAFVNPGSLLGGAVKNGTATPQEQPAVQPPLSEDKR